jgi:nucleoside-diphosphate-sugar epimerase
MTALVTGSRGFLGCHLMAALPDAVGVDLPEVDVCDPIYESGLPFALGYHVKHEAPSTVWHLAALNGSTAGFYEQPWRVLETQIRGTLNVIDACVANGVGTLVLFSSSEVYQTAPKVPTPEDAPFSIPDPSNPRYSYAIGKQAAEAMARWSSIPRVIIIRPFNVYSEDQRPGHVIPDMVAAMKATEQTPEDLASRRPPTFTIKDAGHTRSFIHRVDFTAGCLRIAEHHANDERCREVYNVGTEEQVSISAVTGILARLLGKTFRWKSEDGLPGGTRSRCPDTSKLRALGWAPTVSLEDGLRRCVEAWR